MREEGLMKIERRRLGKDGKMKMSFENYRDEEIGWNKRNT